MLESAVLERYTRRTRYAIDQWGSWGGNPLFAQGVWQALTGSARSSSDTLRLLRGVCESYRDGRPPVLEEHYPQDSHIALGGFVHQSELETLSAQSLRRPIQNIAP